MRLLQFLTEFKKGDGLWFRVESGQVVGYVKSDYCVTGAEAESIAQDVGHLTATINTETLRMRKEANTDSEIVELLSDGAEYGVKEQGTEFTKIVTDTGAEGYVHNDYIEIEINFDQAISVEEEHRQQESEDVLGQRASAEDETFASTSNQMEGGVTENSGLDDNENQDDEEFESVGVSEEYVNEQETFVEEGEEELEEK